MRSCRIFWISLLFIPTLSFGQASGDQATLEARQAEALQKLQQATTTNGTDKGKANSAAPTSAPSSGTLTVQSLESELSAVNTCTTKVKLAYGACAEWLNPEVASFVKDYGALIQGAGMAVSAMADQCKGLGDMLNKGSTVLGLYQVACAAAQSACISSCGAAEKASGQVATNAQKASGESGKSQATYSAGCSTTGSTCTEAANAGKDMPSYSSIATGAGQRQTASANAVAHCQKYKISTESAVMGGIAALKGVMTSKNCEDQNSATTATVDCTSSSSPMYNSKNCKCGRGELTQAECQNINISANSIKPPQVSAGKVGATGANATGLAPATDGGPGGEAGGDVGGASGMAGAPTGGGGGQSGGGGGPQGGAQDGAANPRRMNANILGGFGGGGGGGMGGTGPGYGETDPKLKAYGPGGDKDPSRTVASQLAKEVTPQGGRSNWEKVKTRYRDNIRTLISK